ncbi:MAG: hypothetical protein HKO66_07185, partial [Saprospiraceae bacterium]|nr:hypothetical protein [Saprospiraceae bacterium]
MSKYIKRNILKLMTISILLIVTNTTSVLGTHIVGGQLSYKCLGNDQYEITLTVQRDCENGAEDAPFDDPAVVGVFNFSGSLLTALFDNGRIEMPFIGEDTITNSEVFDCSVLGSAICVHQSTYKAIVSLPYNKKGYILAYQRCCRNSILENISNPLETGATYWVSITPEVLNMCNSQPVFNQWPDVYICANEDLEIDHSAFDADGDELVYRFCTPSQGASESDPQPISPSNPPYDEVVWAPTYGLNNLLGSNSLRINPSTGEITGRPTQIGTYLVGVCVEEYRNGELISTVRRDFEFNVRQCTDPILVDFDVIGNDCDGDTQVSFQNNTVGADGYQWTITDEAGMIIFTSTDEDVEFDFPALGTYTILLEASRVSDGCVARERMTLTIGSPDVIPDFDALFNSCSGGNIIQLNDLSSDPSG